MTDTLAAVIMAAGKSTRMKSALPKAVHPVCGKPMTRHVIDACLEAGVREVVVVIGHGADEVRSALGDDVIYAHQTEQLGTGHACMQALPQVSDNATDVLVLPGDTPLITADDISKLVQSHAAEGNACTLLTAVLDDASHYGRVIRDAQGAVLKVLEAKDADKEALAIREINTSIYCFDKRALAENLSLVKTDNVQKEYYLTDVIELLSSSDKGVGAVIADDPANTLGINNRAELAAASDIMRRRIMQDLMLAGVTIVDPATTCIDCGVQIGADTVIKPCSVIETGTRIGSDCEIGPFAHLSGVRIADGTREVGRDG